MSITVKQYKSPLHGNCSPDHPEPNIDADLTGKTSQVCPLHHNLPIYMDSLQHDPLRILYNGPKGRMRVSGPRSEVLEHLRKQGFKLMEDPRRIPPT